MEFNNSTTNKILDPYSLEPLAGCFELTLVGYTCVVMCFLGIIFNSVLLYACIRFKELKSSLYTCILVLTILNLFGVLVELPFIIISNLSCKWTFGKLGCDASSTIMFFIGCSSIYIMCIISIQRYYIIYWPFNIRKINNLSNSISIGIALLLGAFWSVMPLLGWSYYSLEGANTSCSIEWKEKSFNVVSYNITILVVVFIIPVIIIVFTNLKLLFKVLNLPSVSTNEFRTKQLKDEKRLTINVMIFIIGFLVSWIPYAVVCLYTAFFDHSDIPPLVGTSLAIFAKSSMVWAPMLFIFSNKMILKKFRGKIPSVTSNSTLQMKSYSLNSINKDTKSKNANKTIEPDK